MLPLLLLVVMVPLMTGAVVLAFRAPVTLAIVIVAGSLVLSERTILSLGAAGVNVLDIVIFSMIAVCLARTQSIRERVYGDGRVALLLWIVLAIAVIGVVNGYSSGYPLRGVLRDFRFYVYLLVTFHFAALLDTRDLRRLALTWGVLAMLQFALIMTGRLLYNPDEAGVAVFGEDVFNSATHFLPLKSFAPMLLALAILFAGRGTVSWMRRFGLAAFVCFDLGVMLFTYSRSLYLALSAGVAALLMLTARASGGGLMTYLKMTTAGVAVIAILMVVTTRVAAWALPGTDMFVALENIQQRFVSSAGDDASIGDRQYGMQLSLRAIEAHPLLGSGLGTASDYWAASEFHNCYLWMARSIGLPGAAAFVLALLTCLTQTWARLSRVPPARNLRSFSVGFSALLVAMLIMAAGQPLITNVVHISEWGLVLGILVTIARPSAHS